ncbi:VTT domain-containing protein [Nocardia sp. NEAU-G5]|uniref:VTT domain-containing protein n=1 Tax=Nocardia albiluteola TaxID=2842303 RepID=A0ABS6BD41_9NOCA|nr:VTT domain-containing protein [Nocardia albiluteola]MBU3067138.1 VTT domain-containing protein [Nocardia albiluteola]
MDIAALITAFVVAVLPIAPTEPTLVGLGALAAVLHVSPIVLILVAGLGCSASDHLLYAAGRWGGARVLAWLSRGRATGRATGWLVDRAERWGVPVFVAARWLPAGGSAGAVLAGSLRWRLRRFTPTSLLGSMLWACYATMLGYIGSAFTGNPLAGLGISLIVAVVVMLAMRPFLHQNVTGAPEVAAAVMIVPDDTVYDITPSDLTEPILIAA